MAPSLRIRKVQSIVDKLDEIHDQINQRAYQIFERNGMRNGYALSDWLAAEAEVTWQPSVELAEVADGFVVRAALPGLNPKDIDVRVTPDHLLIHAETRHEHSVEKGAVHLCEFSSGKLFKTISFPRKIDLDKVQTELSNGMLKLTAKAATRAESPRADEPSPPPSRTARKARA